MHPRLTWLSFALVFMLGCPLSSCAQSGPWDAYTARAKQYLIKDDSLWEQLSIDARGISIYASPSAKAADSVECRLFWGELLAFERMARGYSADSLLATYLRKGDQPWDSSQLHTLPPPVVMPPFDPAQPLKGMRIALDPGHVGGTMEFAMLEWKYVMIKADPKHGIPEEVAFNEGNLALGTALLLDSMFRAAGAEVLLTRKQEGMTAFGYGFETWLDSVQMRWERSVNLRHRTALDFISPNGYESYRNRCAARLYLQENEAARKDSAWWMDKAGKVHIYKGPFLRAEFKERARQINAFRPHLSLILHYNVHETNEPNAKGYRDAVDDNVSMAFVPGAFMKGELSTPEDRLAFLVKLCTEDQASSVALSDSVLLAHTRLLGVAPLVGETGLGYIVRASMPTEGAGVYARNLALTRQIHGVMCFGESLYQDNAQECVALNARDFLLPGMTTAMPSRIRAVAKAYYEGVLAWRMRAR